MGWSGSYRQFPRAALATVSGVDERFNAGVVRQRRGRGSYLALNNVVKMGGEGRGRMARESRGRME